jgi:microcystin degradation protein MlrC
MSEPFHFFLAGLSQETNSFIDRATEAADFTIEEGRVAGSPSALSMLAQWEELVLSGGHRCTLGPCAWAPPSGPARGPVYESMRGLILASLSSAGPVDLILLNLHGAMLAQGYDDCEADLLAHIRASVGSETVIGVEFDLHCHLSEAKIAPADIVITYKHYPHVDANARAREVFALSLATRRGEIRPRKALAPCHMLGLYPTNREPLRHLVEAMSGAERQPGILSISMGHGFPFGDVRHGGSKMLVLSDDDAGLATRTAMDFAARAHALRAEIGFENISLSLEDALPHGLALPGLSVIGDQSDNPGGGAPGDATFALRWAIEHNMSDAAFAILCDPEAVMKARTAGVGAIARIALGGKHGPLTGEPIERDWTVVTVRDEVSHSFAQEDGPPMCFPLGAVAVLRHGSIDIIVSSLPCQCYGPDIFDDLGLSLEGKSAVVVKSAQHFTSAFAPVADHLIYMAGPGAVPPDPRMIAYRKLDTSNLYPWNAMTNIR